VTWKILFTELGKPRCTKHRKYQNLRMNNEVTGDKNAIRWELFCDTACNEDTGAQLRTSKSKQCLHDTAERVLAS